MSMCLSAVFQHVVQFLLSGIPQILDQLRTRRTLWEESCYYHTRATRPSLTCPKQDLKGQGLAPFAATLTHEANGNRQQHTLARRERALSYGAETTRLSGRNGDAGWVQRSSVRAHPFIIRVLTVLARAEQRVHTLPACADAEKWQRSHSSRSSRDQAEGCKAEAESLKMNHPPSGYGIYINRARVGGGSQRVKAGKRSRAPSRVREWSD
eukprot:CAMPEP_0183345518 /NCGR_PEP_ID=MMETSP0164_2-20130417/10920_1 /TAXON_ID=221442 /ORGANISM="Coccolithus pelagicus ssp braarudi, Strain PLY182g" /LENGTH=209 /DNA_ID=CAMNT_0025516665 /DNA_START=57 /DNA_END=687 /DNA_ORIENTATION=-